MELLYKLVILMLLPSHCSHVSAHALSKCFAPFAAKLSVSESLFPDIVETVNSNDFKYLSLVEDVWKAASRLPCVRNNGSSNLVHSTARMNISEQCRRDLEEYYCDLEESKLYALQMFHANGELPLDFMVTGNTKSLGTFSQCEAVKDTPTESSFDANYCLVTVDALILPSFTLGYCVPKSCGNEDVVTIVETVTSILPPHLRMSSTSTCNKDYDLDAGAIATICFCVIFGALVVIGTIYDIYIKISRPTHKKVSVNSNADGRATHKGYTHQFILACSFLENGRKILSARITTPYLLCLNGIRVLSFSWVFIGHVFSGLVLVTENFKYFLNCFKGFWYQAIWNATYSVDSFFYLSGLLVTYLSMKQLARNNGKMNWLVYYIHRYWRITWVLLFVMLFYTYLTLHIFDGPMYQLTYEGVAESCKEYWWTNILYINNLYPFPGVIGPCIGWVWYLACDMQFYWLSPPILILLHRSWKWGMGLIASLCVACWCVVALIATYFGEVASMFHERYNDNIDDANGVDVIYGKSYTRWPVYMVGMVTGYILYRLEGKKFKMRVAYVVSGWCAAIATGLAIIYGLWYTVEGHYMPQWLAVLYITLSRPAWAAALGWMTIACVTGYGGPVNTILSWKIWIPLSRLTFSAYMIHLPVIAMGYMSRDRLLFYDVYNVVYLILGGIVLTFAVAFTISVFLESPTIGWEKIVLKRKK
uniref:Nose resistant to fluoxetine protein 6-like n=1 Tax=Saccoglossus kowalevskii TaxID=10224 RepID=A0ABM0MLC5_SACKO|nr:PREDICTED: nose resistant to fluoxetine protein 6-like [Saccoglossus kowalevskii]